MATKTGLRARVGSFAVDTRPLRIPAYRRLFAASVVTTIGTQLTSVAVPTQVFAMTGSSGYVGLAGAFGLVPLIVFALWGGAIADTVDRRTLLIVTNVGIALVSALLWVQAFAGLGSVWVLLGLFAVQQGLFGVNSPARSAAIARLVPVELLPQASALGGTVFQFGAVIGPLLAGVLIPVLGLGTLYLIDAAALMATLWAVWAMPALPPLSGTTRAAGLADIVDGFRYLLRYKVLLASFLADVIAMVAGMPRALFPQIASHTFGDPLAGASRWGGCSPASRSGRCCAGCVRGGCRG